MTLYEISSELSEIEDALIESGGEIPEGEAGEAFEQWWAHLQDRRDEKLRNICALIANSEAEAEMLKAEGKRLMQAAKARENLVDRLKSRVKDFFEVHKIQKLNLGIFKPRIQQNSSAPLVFPEMWASHPTRAPREFQRVVIELDKEAIREKVAMFGLMATQVLNAIEDPAERQAAFAQWLAADDSARKLRELIEGCGIGERGTHLRIR